MRIEKDLELKKILKSMCPGTALREGLENILRAKTGGLIVLGDSEKVMDVVDGGFLINSEYTPAYIYELANAFNRFYHETKILAEEDQAKKESYLALLMLVKNILEACIDMLGFEAPERM